MVKKAPDDVRVLMRNCSAEVRSVVVSGPRSMVISGVTVLPASVPKLAVFARAKKSATSIIGVVPNPGAWHAKSGTWEQS